MSFIVRRLRAFKYAFNGLITAINMESVYWIHILATVIVVITGLLFSINKFEWLILILCIGLVWIAELINSAIERLCNFISSEDNIQIKNIKDISAGGVLVASVIAFICFLIVLIKYLTYTKIF
ncbi:MAG: diacylglycerol kinase family protein [Sphingobacteriaceae bacterium]|nr:diacylglycerol kinase family protein [Sphingobacteriaceae bacterium]